MAATKRAASTAITIIMIIMILGTLTITRIIITGQVLMLKLMPAPKTRRLAPREAARFLSFVRRAGFPAI